MSSTLSSSSSSTPPRRPSKRSKLRNGTFIDPSTGERSRRQFSLHNPAANSLDGASPATNLTGTGYWAIWDSQRTARECLKAIGHNVGTATRRTWRWACSDLGHGVLKCTLAYLLGSLFTFWQPLRDILGRPEGKHIVATITVYFHPARTVGSMLEAAAISIIAVTYAEIVCVSSMLVSVVVGAHWGARWLSYVLVLVFFIGGGLGFVGWVKQRLNYPLVNVACTLASMAIISVVTTENAVQTGVFSNMKIVQVLKMLVFGISITVAVNVLLWRKSARHLLRRNMTAASTCLGDMLSMITRGFLSGSEDELLNDSFSRISEEWSSVNAQMNKNLREEKFEHYFLGHEKIYHLDKQVFKSLEGLAQSIGGLRSSANTQFALMKESGNEPLAGTPSPRNSVFSPTLTKTFSGLSKNLNRSTAQLSVIDESPLEADEPVRPVTPATREQTRIFRTPGDIFELFIALLGPSIKSLAYTLSEILREPSFGGEPGYNTITVNDSFRQSLTDAVDLYNGHRAAALKELYKSIELDKSRSEKIQADFEEVAAACGHFSFSLQNFGDEMGHYLDVLDELKLHIDKNARSWSWLRFWSHWARFRSAADGAGDLESEPLIRPIRKSAVPKGIPDALINRRDSFAWEAAPQASRVVRSLSQKLLKSLRVLARDDIRFGLKVGIGASLWAMLAFLPQTQPVYMHWRGEWGLLSFMIVCSMTVGASNTTGYARFLGTVIGASCAVLNWTLSDGNGVILAFLGWCVSLAAFYVILVVGNAPLGRITLLAYNVSTLYAYSVAAKAGGDGSENDDDDDEGGVNPLILEIVKHRVTAVMAGILWGLIVCRLIWPISARKKFKEGLSVLYLRMGLIWKRGPLADLLGPDRPSTYLKSGEQAALQRYGSKLEMLRKSAGSEFELRGPFPSKAMGRIMASTMRIMDGFHAMGLVKQRRLENRPGGHHLSAGEKALLAFTERERKVLCQRICHVFQVLASSVMLEYPLTEAIPSIHGSRDRLLGRIYAFRTEYAAVNAERGNGNADGGAGGVQGSSEETSGLSGSSDNGPSRSSSFTLTNGESRRGSMATLNDGLAGGANTGSGIIRSGLVIEERDYAILYAYVLVTNQVVEELKLVEREIELLYGMLNEDVILLQ